MDPVDLRARLRAALEPSPAPALAPGDRLAAVLAPLVERPELSVILTERSERVPRHAGEISFPGGLVEAVDADLAATALREAEEEIGLDRRLTEILGALPAVHTSVSGILVVPFVGMLEDLPTLVLDDGEIRSVLLAPVRRLLEVETLGTWERPGGRRWTGFVYEVEGRTVWGATGRMLHDLLEIIRKEMP